MAEHEIWYLIDAVLKHHRVLGEGSQKEMRRALIQLQQVQPHDADKYYITKHKPSPKEDDGFEPLEF